MKLVSFRAKGAAHYGVVSGNGVVDLTPRLGSRYADLKALIAANALAEAEKAAKGAAADFKLDQIQYAPVIANPGKILCVGLNYEEHRVETGRPKVENPTIFVRFADTQIGHLQPVVRPKGSENLDYEAELAAVIGRGVGPDCDQAAAWARTTSQVFSSLATASWPPP